MGDSYFVHETSLVDEPARIGAGTRIWHYSHLSSGCILGAGCNLGQNVFIAGGVTLGSNVKIQNNVSIYEGTIIEDDVFLGPSCVLTNVSNPRSQINRKSLYEKTLIRRGATVGANATIVCGITVGRYAFIAAGAVVTRNVPDYGLVAGVPGRRIGWVSRHGLRLPAPDGDGIMTCPESGLRFRLNPEGEPRCLDLDEEAPLPESMANGLLPYPQLKTLRA